MVKNLGDAVVNVHINVTGMNNLSTLGTNLRDLGSLAGRVAASFRKSGTELVQFGINVRRVSFAMRDAGRQFLLFGGALAAALTAITVEGAAFEQGLANTVSVMSDLQIKGAATSATIEQLSEFLLRLAADTVFTAAEITDAASALALAGFSAKEVMESMRGIADLAAASGEDAKSVAESAAVILRSFKLDVKDIERVADALTAASVESLTSLQDLRESFKMVAPVAAAFGLQLEDTAAALAVLANTGMRGSLAGTGLSRLLTQLASDVKKVNELLIPLGSSQDKVDPLKHSIRDIVAEFERLIVSGKLSEAALAGAFDQRAVRALLNLIGQGSVAFDEMSESIDNSLGLTKEIAKVRLDTVIGQFKLLTSEISALSTVLFQTFAKELKSFITTLKDTTKGFSEWVSQNKEFVKVVLIATAVISAIAITMGTFLTVVGSAAAAVAGLIVVAGVLGASLGALVVFGGLAALALASITAIVVGLILLIPDLVDGLTWLIGKIAQLFGARSDAKFAEQIEEATETLKVFGDELDNSIDKAASFASKMGKALSIMKAGGTATAGQIAELVSLLNELGVQSSSDLTKELDSVLDEYDAQVEKINAKIEEANANGLPLDTKLIQSLEERANMLLDQAEGIAERLQEFRSIESILLDVDAGDFDTKKKQIEDDLLKFKEELEGLKSRDSLTDSEDIRVTELETLLSTLRDEQNLIRTFTAETFKIAKDALFQFGSIPKALSAVDGFTALQAAARDAAAAFNKAATEAGESFNDAFSRINKGAKTSLESKIEELNTVSKQLEEAFDILNSAVVSPIAKGVLDGQRQAALAEVQRQKDELFKEQSANRADTVRELALERAKLAKDVKEAQRLLKEDRVAEREDKLKSTFEVPDTADPAQIAQNQKDRLAFINEHDLATQRLLDSLKEELEKVDEIKDKTKDINRKESERNEIEKAIAQQLTNQVKSLSDAQAVLQFARGQQEQRFREAREGAADEALAESRLFDSIKKRAALEAKGQDTTAIERRIRLQEKLRQVASDRRNVLDGQTGVTQDRESTFKADLAQIEIEAAELATKIKADNILVLNSAIQGVADVLAGAPKLWVDLLISGWSSEIPRFIQAILGLGLPNPNTMPAMPATVPGLMVPIGPISTNAPPTYNDNKIVTFNINEATDAEAVAKIVQNRLFKTPPRFTA